jgi:hypothetical protein
MLYTETIMNPFKNPFVRGMLYAQWAYWCAWGICVWAQLYMPAGSVRTVLILLPILPGVLIIAVGIWQYQVCDEYIRLRVLKAATATAVITAVWTLAYSYLEVVGLPRLSMMWVSNIGWLVFVFLMIRLMLEGHEEPVT